MVTNSPQLKCRVNCIYRCSCTSLHGKGVEKEIITIPPVQNKEAGGIGTRFRQILSIRNALHKYLWNTQSWPVFHQATAESLDQRTIILVRFPALSSISSLKPDFEKASIISISVSISTSSIRPACSPQSAILILPVSSDT